MTHICTVTFWWSQAPSCHLFSTHNPYPLCFFPVFTSWVPKSHYSYLVVSDSLWPHGLWPTRLLWPWNSPGKNTRVGSHSLLQRFFPTQGLNPGILNCRKILYHLSHQESPKYLKNICWYSLLIQVLFPTRELDPKLHLSIWKTICNVPPWVWFSSSFSDSTPAKSSSNNTLKKHSLILLIRNNYSFYSVPLNCAFTPLLRSNFLLS